MGLDELLGRAQGLLSPVRDSLGSAYDAVSQHIDDRAAAYQRDAAAAEARDQAYRQAQWQSFLELMNLIRTRGLKAAVNPEALPAAGAGMIPGVSGVMVPGVPWEDATTRPIIGGVRD